MKLIPTLEQQNIVETAKTGINIAVHAGAGTSKTTTCLMIAEKHFKMSLYVAFTTANKAEAKIKFDHLQHVEVNNWHSMAWHAIVKGTNWSKGRGKDSKCVGYWDIKGDITKIIDDETVDAREVVDILKEFCKSSFPCVGDYILTLKVDDLQQGIFKICASVWEALTNPKNNFKINHDIYLKMWQLSNPDLSKKYEVIYLDEFQDTNPVCLDIFLKQQEKGVQLIAVGDEAQAIYGFRGAVNAFDYIPKEEIHFDGEDPIQNQAYFSGWKHLTLSESFRFGQEIAEQANVILSAMNSSMRLIGRGTKTKIETRATLVRNNSTLFNILLAAADTGQKVEVIADLKDLYNKLWTASFIKNSAKKEKTEYGMYPDTYMKGFENWDELVSSSDPEARKIVNILSSTNKITWEEDGKELNGLKAAIAKANSAIWDIKISKSNPDFTLLTGHKAKGNQYGEVTLTDDFLPTIKNVKDEETGELIPEDWEETWKRFKEEQGCQLLYVAITRAEVKLNLTPALLNFTATLSRL